MSDENQIFDPPAFVEYECSLGTVIAHDAGSYVIRTPDGRVIGIVANGELSPANVEADIASPGTVPAPVPAEITRAQFVIAARRVLGLTEGGIFALISQLPAGEMQETARDLWENALTFKRGNSMLNALAQLNGNTPEQLDELFRHGAALDLDA
jgi:hypothetical protein